MKNLSKLLKSIMVNGVIPPEKALNIAEQYDIERNETIELLKGLESQVGLHWGEEIKARLAKMDGTMFNPVDYHYERLPNGQ